MNATTTALPVIYATMPVGKDDGYRTRKGAANLAGSFGDLDAAGVVKADGDVFRVFVVSTIRPAPETTPCTDCGVEVPTLATGEGDRATCSKGTPMYPGHRVSSSAYMAAVEYRSAQRALAAGDTRYSTTSA